MTPTPPANAFVSAAQCAYSQTCYPLDVYFCEECGHVQLLDIVDPEVLFRNYVYVTGTSPIFVEHFRRYAESLAHYTAPAGNKLAVDIGSNDGTLLRILLNQGWQVLGIDPARDIATRATAAGIETIATFLDQRLAGEILTKYGQAEIITANNVFAHIDGLSDVVKAVRSMLAPTGIFSFEVSYLRDVYEHVLFDTIYHEHLDYHTVAPLVGFFAAHEMALFAARRVDSHGGSLRGYVQHASGPRQADGSIETLIAEEQALGLDDPATFRDFGAAIARRKNELSNLLQHLKKEGRRIVGFGAPAKATTLMYHFEIGPEIIDYIVDDNPLKQDQYSPGLHIPVVSSDALYDDPPDYAVILAWNFADPIIANHQKFRDDGGHFIVPLPEVRVH